jgi:hypothetical protein
VLICTLSQPTNSNLLTFLLPPPPFNHHFPLPPASPPPPPPSPCYPPNTDWVGDPLLPAYSREEPCPVKTSLLIMPSNLVGQWQAEIATHLAPGALKVRERQDQQGCGVTNVPSHSVLMGIQGTCCQVPVVLSDCLLLP